MKFNLATGHPWHEFSRMVLNARSMEIDGYTGDVDVENVDGHLVIKVPEPEKPKAKPVLKALKGGKA